MNPVRTALVSVYDKRGLPELAAALVRRGVTVISTGGTARMLESRGIAVREVSDVTGFPELLDGRVKTLHPAVHAGILARRGRPADLDSLSARGIAPIDLVVVNLYPFAERTACGIGVPEALEEIDIGGVTLVRAAAKNFPDVTVVVDPEDYAPLIAELDATGAVAPATRLALARKAFEVTAGYDACICQYLNNTAFSDGVLHHAANDELLPEYLCRLLRRHRTLRYGENPHQQAAVYGLSSRDPEGWLAVEQLHGKELSYNNYQDMDAAWQVVAEFDECACAIIKHANPCGTALAADCAHAYRRARDADPDSAYGSIIAFNRMLDGAAAQEMAKLFIEVIVAPEFSPEALDILRRKRDLRLIRKAAARPGRTHLQIRSIEGAFLVQEADTVPIRREDLRVVTVREPADALWDDLWFAWKCVKHVKSNAIVVARELQLLGVGAGQMSRVDSARLAISKSRQSLTGAVLASDAFIPFRDTLDLAADAGLAAIIQPGGSIRDEEVVAAANELGLAMVFTGRRHFRH
jgi:phosphoribosylaminoimidazolecarboxamide formyltransferase/IMP cyclohydrolase